MSWTAPSTWVAGAVLTAAELNEQLRDNMLAIGAPWTAYTPALTSVTLGTGGTVSGAYMNAGKLVAVRFLLTLGTGGSFTGFVTLGLPSGLSISASYAARCPVGQFGARDDSAGTLYEGSIVRQSGATYDAVSLFAYNASATYVTASAVGAAIPFTWAASDTLYGSLLYEAA